MIIRIKKKSLRQFLILFLIVLIIIPIVYAPSVAVSKTFLVYMTLGNAAPFIIWVNQTVTVDPLEASNVTLQFYFNVSDTNGATTLDASSAKVEVKFNGISRTSFACSNVQNASSTVGVWNCSVQFAYFDNASASWTINASIRDTSDSAATNATGTFTYNTLSAFALKSTVINFTGVSLGQSNVAAATNPWIVNNTGNDDFDNINITGTELRGVTTPSEIIGVGNITVNSSAAAPFGYAMINNTQVRITGATLIHGDPSQGIGNLSLYFFISVPSTGFSSQDYNATIPWTIRAYNEP